MSDSEYPKKYVHPRTKNVVSVDTPADEVRAKFEGFKLDTRKTSRPTGGIVNQDEVDAS